MAEFFACSVYRQFSTALRLVVCSVLFSYIRGSKTGYSVRSQLTNLSLIKEDRTDSAWEQQILKGQIKFSPLSLIMGIAMSFWWEKLQKTFVSGQSGVRSGNSMTTRQCVANADTLHTLLSLAISKHRSRAISGMDYLRVGRSMFHLSLKK